MCILVWWFSDKWLIQARSAEGTTLSRHGDAGRAPRRHVYILRTVNHSIGRVPKARVAQNDNLLLHHQ